MRELLQQHFITIGFSSEELDILLGICEYQQLSEGQIVFSEQQPSYTFFILVKGKVTLFFGSDRIIEVSPGQVFGDWAMLSDTARLATARANLPSEAIAIDYEKLKDANTFPAHVALKVVFSLTKPIIARLQSPSQIASKILIGEGENQKVEFKETLRTNTYTGKKDDRMEFAALKAMAGFLNSKGGVLFIGVRDDGTLTGLSIDGFANEDKLLLHVGHLISDKLGKNAAAYISLALLNLEEKLILRVDCSPSPVPIYLDDKNQHYFFVRQGAQTLAFNIRESVRYIHEHF
ncbi:RNA-binding domain-containing protein [Phaeodactylibacter xiamenensis]|uniref:RNA-binding domain-containing protein n=1 Tax=Phaeodactylibacter xiamenensis TaxID=1524460 RepID=UPI0024A93F7E|nr:RNA-binding domain-containing protein [Phaeodactylibacter xiamenensis]